ncbi:type IV secretory system conjugative DNA transfer family protein [Phaeobacter marinintestinus]|uniref:type IV secretory system conjugative DNA transfer family protein n=1 Tax=Falsiphaeobacter marinintestinus TaxID=1492905 RepID=UPI0011B64896|nr:type IV secretion system DNA-binding domain-containing protein [Phaeobacter marinintestinus]
MHTAVTTLGLAWSRYGSRSFGIRLADRMQHLYIIGQTGTGKSTLLLNMALQDAALGAGFCLIDPHGDLAEDLARRLGKRALVWRPFDPDCLLGYNPLTRTTSALRPLVTSGLITTLRHQWADAWGVRMEHLLRHAILALLDQPATDLRDIMHLFLNREFRKTVIAHIIDPQLLQFWTEEYPGMNYKTAADGVVPIANKLGTFLSHPVVRQALCEPIEPLRFRSLMDDGGILIVNLAKGRLGSDIANLLGGLVVSSLTHAAFTRDLGSPRRPFMLYVDEFHNFTTDALAETLSETRKYGLSLTLAQQHCRQSSEALFAGIMGNVGSLIAFRTGALDAGLMAQQLGEITPDQLITLPNYQTLVRLMVDGTQTRAFSAETSPPPDHRL